jgi:hypothetical protein
MGVSSAKERDLLGAVQIAELVTTRGSQTVVVAKSSANNAATAFKAIADETLN